MLCSPLPSPKKEKPKAEEMADHVWVCGWMPLKLSNEQVLTMLRMLKNEARKRGLKEPK